MKWSSESDLIRLQLEKGKKKEKGEKLTRAEARHDHDVHGTFAMYKKGGTGGSRLYFYVFTCW